VYLFCRHRDAIGAASGSACRSAVRAVEWQRFDSRSLPARCSRIRNSRRLPAGSAFSLCTCSPTAARAWPALWCPPGRTVRAEPAPLRAQRPPARSVQLRRLGLHSQQLVPGHGLFWLQGTRETRLRGPEPDCLLCPRAAGRGVCCSSKHPALQTLPSAAPLPQQLAVRHQLFCTFCAAEAPRLAKR
jgi:hypothetical protein